MASIRITPIAARTIFALMCSSAIVPLAHAAGEVSVKPDTIGGVVTSAKGPEAGVWVIAQTSDLPTRVTKIVVTDDKGRYLIPEMPKGKYKVWVRGYGLVDSAQVDGTLGKQLDLKAVVAPNAAAAAQYYPANYWSSMLSVPAKAEFPGTGPTGNGIPPTMKTQQQFIGQMKQCTQCHQLGDKATREIAINNPEAWIDRVQMARPNGDPAMGDQAHGYMNFMNNAFTAFGRERAAGMFTNWTGKITEGALPPAPPRPQGVERNIVLTLFGWGDKSYFHDEVASDRRNPTINAGGPIYGIQILAGKFGILDPKTAKYKEMTIPGAYDGYTHTVMMDEKKRVWMPDGGPSFQPHKTPPVRPAFCTDAAANKYAAYFPLNGRSGNFVYVYDPADSKIAKIDSCLGAGHVWFGYEANTTLYFGTQGVGWIDSKVWDETKDANKAHGWCPLSLDTNATGDAIKTGAKPSEVVISGNYKEWNTLNKGEFDPKKDTLVPGGLYGIGVSPVDNSVWGGLSSYPGGVVRVDRGTNAPETCKTEYYEPPKRPDGSYMAFQPHDLNIDTKGIAWVSFTGGQIGRFDRTKCKVMRGPQATGQHCAEGWTIHDAPGPHFAGTDDGAANADELYQTFVDRFDTFGLGKDVATFAGSNSDSVQAFLPEEKKWVTLRVPYPMGFFTRWMDGRIDDANAGWKGRAGYATYSSVTPFHQEEGDESKPELVKFQVRPNPLAD